MGPEWTDDHTRVCVRVNGRVTMSVYRYMCVCVRVSRLWAFKLSLSTQAAAKLSART